MSERNTVSWTSLICGYARGNLVKEVVSLFFEMVMAGVEPNSVTTVCVISACAKLKDLELSERVCAYLGESGVKVNTLMIFDEYVDKNLLLYNTILSNYVRQGLAREALAVFEMTRQGYIVVRVHNWAILCSESLIKCGDLKSAWQMFNEMPKSDLVSWNTP
ncbi:hypothetical protein PS2_012317 [Malus domestica]|uniref:Pentacotripeptide-repeat region of PRORP domain-containing protein n=1 Tax=Malus domestica TaxID=3750 RepID=A0A498I3Q2_MALDO|nr:hypothetical protein DVH24_001684 [Malus domestica]